MNKAEWGEKRKINKRKSMMLRNRQTTGIGGGRSPNRLQMGGLLSAMVSCFEGKKTVRSKRKKFGGPRE